MDRDGLVVVTGAGGFLGGHLVGRLLAEGHRNVRAVDIKPFEAWYQRFEQADNLCLDLREKSNCYRVCEGARQVFQLAADMGGMGFIARERARCMLSVLINAHMLLAARDLRVERIFFSSSACVYNVALQQSSAPRPLREQDAYPAMPEDGYGWEKLFSERLYHHFQEEFGLEVRIARYHNAYGPHGTWEGGREKAPAAICRKVIEAVCSGREEIEIWGDGKQSRSFMYVDDAIEGTLRLMRSEVSEPLNIGSAELVTIDQLVDVAEEIAGVKLRRRYVLSEPQGVRGRSSDNSRIRALLGWEPAIPLRVGLEKTYRWIHEQFCARHGRAGQRTICA